MATTTIWDITDPYGAPRFHPPGRHPATRQWREALAKAERYEGTSDDADAYIAYLRDQLAMFEEGESVAKAHADERLR